MATDIESNDPYLRYFLPVETDAKWSFAILHWYEKKLYVYNAKGVALAPPWSMTSFAAHLRCTQGEWVRLFESPIPLHKLCPPPWGG